MQAREVIKARAMSICEARARQLASNEADIQAFIERAWPVTAALLSACLIDESGNEIPHTIEQGLAAMRAWEAWQR